METRWPYGDLRASLHGHVLPPTLSAHGSEANTRWISAKRYHMEDRFGLDGDTSRSLSATKFYESDRQLEYHDWFNNFSTFRNPR